MSWANIRTALAARIQAIDPGAKVWDYERFTKTKPDSPEFKAIFLDADDVIHCWMVTWVHRIPTAEKGENFHRIKWTALLLGFMGLWDPAASDRSFSTIVEAVAEDLRTGDRTLGGACETLGEVDAGKGMAELQAQIEEFHLAQLQFDIYEEVAA